jgi:hypothetical protein
MPLIRSSSNRNLALSSRTALATIAATAVLSFGAAVLSAHLLPFPFSAIGPVQELSTKFELIRQPIGSSQKLCLIIAGDSRAAFNINAAELSSPDCVVRNIGFPAFPHAMLLDLVELARPDQVAFVMSEPFFLTSAEHAAASAPPPRMTGNVSKGASPIETARIAMYRWAVAFDSFVGSPIADHVYRWDQSLGRWLWPQAESAVFDSRADTNTAAEVIAKSYFTDTGVWEQSIAALIDDLKALTKNVALVLPPEHPSFARASHDVSPELQQTFRSATKRLASAREVPVIDCSIASDCGLSDTTAFADVFHLNGVGAKAFTAALKRKLDAVGIKTESK